MSEQTKTEEQSAQDKAAKFAQENATETPVSAQSVGREFAEPISDYRGEDVEMLSENIDEGAIDMLFDDPVSEVEDDQTSNPIETERSTASTDRAESIAVAKTHSTKGRMAIAASIVIACVVTTLYFTTPNTKEHPRNTSGGSAVPAGDGYTRVMPRSAQHRVIKVQQPTATEFKEFDEKELITTSDVNKKMSQLANSEANTGAISAANYDALLTKIKALELSENNNEELVREVVSLIDSLMQRLDTIEARQEELTKQAAAQLREEKRRNNDYSLSNEKLARGQR